MAGYLRQPERTAATGVNGWLDTGDPGLLHDGELYVCGRSKGVIMLRCRKYAAHEIKQARDAVPGAQPGRVAAVSHRPEDAEEEQLILFVEARNRDPDLATHGGVLTSPEKVTAGRLAGKVAQGVPSPLR